VVRGRTLAPLPLFFCLALLTGCQAAEPETMPTADEAPVVPEGRSHTLRATGERDEPTLHVFGAHADANMIPRFEVDSIPGTYRIVITSAYWDHDGPPWGGDASAGGPGVRTLRAEGSVGPWS
jgi:hypothetical protein